MYIHYFTFKVDAKVLSKLLLMQLLKKINRGPSSKDLVLYVHRNYIEEKFVIFKGRIKIQMNLNGKPLQKNMKILLFWVVLILNFHE